MAAGIVLGCQGIRDKSEAQANQMDVANLPRQPYQPTFPANLPSQPYQPTLYLVRLAAVDDSNLTTDEVCVRRTGLIIGCQHPTGQEMRPFSCFNSKLILKYVFGKLPTDRVWISAVRLLCRAAEHR